jgi:DNA-binding transcriptional MerR regulator
MSETPLGPQALAKLTGVSTDTLRHYERLGLLPGIVRTSAGYRRYQPEVVDRVRLIQRALVIGFTLKELASVLSARERGTPPCGKVRSLVGDRLAALERRLEELVVLRDQMKLLLRDWDERLARTPPGQRARLLDMLAERKGLKGKSNRQLSNRVIG